MIMWSSRGKLEDHMQTYGVTGAIETALGTAKMNGNRQGVETHFHSYSLGDAINIGAEGSQMLSTYLA